MRGKMPVQKEEIIEATGYTIGTNIDNNEARLMLHDHGKIIGSMILEGAELYELAHRLLRAYDELEGL